MANPYHHESSGYPPDSSPPRGYVPPYQASYAALTNPNASFTTSPTPPLNRLSHLLNPASEPTSDLYSAHGRASYTDPDRDGASGDNINVCAPPRTTQLPSASRAFEMFMSNGSTDHYWTNKHRNNSFFVPSYLKGSSYIQKLEDVYRAQAAQRESQSSAAAATTSSSASLQNGHSPTSTSKQSPGSHFGMKIDVIERAPTSEYDDAVAPLPTKWNKDDKFGGLEVIGDGQEVKYNTSRSTREQDHEVCSIRADHAMPNQAGLYYFEISILSRRRDETSVCIGVSNKSVPLSRPPGWEPESWGYHGDDGEVYVGANVGKKYGARFGPGDFVGCGVNFRTRRIFFTRNGVIQNSGQPAARDIKGKLYPTIGVKKTGEHIRVNFGHTPFVFDIDAMMMKEQQAMRDSISQTSIDRLIPGMDETELIQQLVLQFLQHDGYVETARAFANEIQNEKQALNLSSNKIADGATIKDDEDANRRQRIRRAVLEGDIDRALKYTNLYYPHVLEENDHVYFKLRCRKFIEMVRRSAEPSNSGLSKKASSRTLNDVQSEMDVDEFDDEMETDGGSEADVDDQDLLAQTIEYGQALQAEFKDDPRRDVRRTLQDIFALLAYPNPLKVKELAPQLDRRGRAAVAEDLNSAILSSLGKSSRSALETLYGQTSVLLDYMREDGGSGSFVTIQSVIDDIPKSQPF
ncbi:SPRY domain-containing protein [Microdochium bolleyi]|uniref:SPRY domain-containing protein n=1 Tax=Microdochium bolleyi TaxID=196109 RepID=A0A136IRR1_9PEZI|nr:SPRY domain-containing protein [Microdochium bolleyi]